MTDSGEYIFRPAWWVPGAHAQTLWGKFLRRRPHLATRVERWTTADDDFIDVVRLAHQRPAARLLLLHGLEGTIRSHYVGGFLAQAAQRGWSADVLLFRGCGPELNRARRFYHSGETTDLAFIVERLLEEDAELPLLLAGVSLGGNVMLKWLGERGADLPPVIRGAAAISVPFDLEQSARHINRGVSRIYDRHFVRTLRAKAMAKLTRYPDLFDARRLARARSLWDFDDVVTSRIHGFADARDYYTRSSSLQFLRAIRLPTFLLSAADDPFMPDTMLAGVRAAASDNPSLSLEFPTHGGHVGFVSGDWPWKPFYYGEWRACEFLASRLDGNEADTSAPK